uniref:EGF-like domain-containing protein n=1 Tax=Panagrellus redivivus TaxID=6233 RepID=A0A7E4VSX8_PANRE
MVILDPLRYHRFFYHFHQRFHHPRVLAEGSVCDAYPCWNDGICIETSPRSSHGIGIGVNGNSTTDSGYICMCSPSFTGDHCQTKIIDHCASLVCKAGTACIQEVASACLPLNNFSTLPKCPTNPCMNGGQCVSFGGSSFQRCLCTPLFHGGLCEISNSEDLFSHLSSTTANWSFLQTFLLFVMLILIAAAILTFCYGGNLSCYLLLPDTRQRYSKWRDAALDELSWDPDGLEDDFDDDFQIQIAKDAANANANGSSIEAIELKTRSMKISTTSETFVSYDPTNLAADDTQHALLPSVIS